jgi:type VI secretion system protein ImpH
MLPEHLERELAALVERAPRIPFVALVEHLERVLGAPSQIGRGGLVRDERIRFRHDPSLVFHSSDVAAMRLFHRGVELTSTFLGATGSVSPLASFFTEEVLRAEAHDGGSLGAFYDLFHHRLLALCYRALQRNRLAWTLRSEGDDELTGRALAVVGLPPKRKDAPLSSVALLGRARVLAGRPRSRQALEVALALAFPNWRIRIGDFYPRRLRLGDDERLRLGVQNHRLGVETRIGVLMQGQSDLLRLCIGPVDRTTFETLLPGAPGNTRLRSVVEDITGGMIDADVEVEILAGHEPRASLGKGARLGRSSLVRRSGSLRTLRMRVPLNGEVATRPTFHS